MTTNVGLSARYVGKHRRCPRHPHPGEPVTIDSIFECDAYCWTRTPTAPMDTLEEEAQ